MKKTKNGATSIYVVIFMALVVGIITASFIRLVISETTRTINDDLSQSAYDSALAGVEDAKAAILAGKTIGWDKCNGIFGMENNEEVLLGSTTSAEGGKTESVFDQAYTCVKVYDELSSYNTTLSDVSRTRIIPIPNGSINTIRISWYSRQNSGNNDTFHFMPSGKFENKNSNPKPPVVVATLVPESGDDVASLVLHPSSGSSNKTTISSGAVNTAYHVTNQNSANDISCKIQDDYACNVDIQIGGSEIRSLSHIAIDMPYGDAETDFKIELCDGSCDGSGRVQFKGVQYKIDSTGRANDLFRRVEAYVDLTDQNFPYPEYAVYASPSGDDGNGVWKNFWVTRNNWYGDNSGAVQ